MALGVDCTVTPKSDYDIDPAVFPNLLSFCKCKLKLRKQFFKMTASKKQAEFFVHEIQLDCGELTLECGFGRKIHSQSNCTKIYVLRPMESSRRKVSATICVKKASEIFQC